MTMCPSQSFDEKELACLLRGIKKEKFLDKLMETEAFSTCDAIAALPPDQLPEGIPKMVTRTIKKVVDDTEELRFLCLRSGGNPRYAYFEALLAANLRSLQDITSRAVEQLPPSKMQARLVQKKALKMVEAKELYSFLKSTHKEQYLFNLIDLELMKPEDVRDCNAFGNAVPKMIARLLKKRAKQVCKPNEPNYQVTLSDEMKEEVTQIWKLISACSHKSFGTTFYETLLTFDSAAHSCFDGANLNTVGMDFDTVLGSLVRDLDKQDTFINQRDELVKRLIRYQIPAQTLWLAVDAFEVAAVLTNPEVDVLHDLEPWRQLYFAIIPPLHPFLIKTIPLRSLSIPKDNIRNELVGSDFSVKLVDWFGRQGHVCLAQFLRDQQEFGDKIVQSFESLHTWMQGEGAWTDFEGQMKILLEGDMTQELKQLLLVEICRAVEDLASSPVVAHHLEGLLTAGGIALFGTQIVTTYRSVQKDLVWDQWDQVYRFAREDCGERLYEIFTADDYGKAMFARTNMKRQREVFVHQLNSTLIRINESNGSVLRTLLIESGHIHRERHRVESKAMMGFEEPLKQAVSEMLGRTLWRRRALDSWSYVVRAIFSRYMLVGWACGSDRKSEVLDWKLLREFRDCNDTKYQIFFHRFAKSMGSAGLLHTESDVSTAATRYMTAVNCILDEPDSLAAVDRVEALTRRHQKFHGVSQSAFSEAGKLWINCATDTFGGKLNKYAKLHFARFWDLLSFAGTTTGVSLVKELKLHEDNLGESQRKLQDLNQADVTVLTLQEKIFCAKDMVILRFKSSKPVPQRGGQFVKLRIKIGNNHASRFYSVASAPDPATDTSDDLEFLIKEVKGGKVSPFLIHDISPETRVEYLTTAGSFALPNPIDGCKRIMISAGVGIVAFISAIRSVVKMAEANMLTKKVHLSLVHSERTLELPVIDELVEISNAYDKNNDYFQFDITLCCTGKSLDAAKTESLRSRCPKFFLERAGSSIFLSALNEFSVPKEVPLYACGPKVFQKMVRETFLKDFGHPRKLVNLEFFDL